MTQSRYFVNSTKQHRNANQTEEVQWASHVARIDDRKTLKSLIGILNAKE